MNAIELLKEALDASVRVLDGLNARIDRASKQGEPIPVYNGIVELHDFIGKIDAYLATPAPDAMEIVVKIRDYGRMEIISEDSALVDFTLSDTEAAALIESYGRRVPRAMLEELWEYCTTDHDFSPGELSESEIVDMSKIAAKYDVKVEG